MQPKLLNFEELFSIYKSGYIFTIFDKLFHFWLIKVRLAGTLTDIFTVFVFLIGQDFVVLTRKNVVLII